MGITHPDVSPYERTVMRRIATELEGVRRFIRLAAEDARCLNEDGLVADLDQLDAEVRRILEDWQSAHALVPDHDG